MEALLAGSYVRRTLVPVGTGPTIASCLPKETRLPRYFFSTTHEEQHHDHEEPVDLPDDRAAWSEATIACGEILRDIDGKLKPEQRWRMDVNNEDHELIFSLWLIPEVYKTLDA
jgi:hypothetical protein